MEILKQEHSGQIQTEKSLLSIKQNYIKYKPTNYFDSNKKEDKEYLEKFTDLIYRKDIKRGKKVKYYSRDVGYYKLINSPIKDTISLKIEFRKKNELKIKEKEAGTLIEDEEYTGDFHCDYDTLEFFSVFKDIVENIYTEEINIQKKVFRTRFLSF